MKINVIIPAAGYKSRIKKNIPISNIIIGKKNLIDRQIECISNCLKGHEYDIILVGGYQFNKIHVTNRPDNLCIVYNKDYITTNICYSIRLAMEYARYENFLLIYGDLFLGINFLQYQYDQSCLFLNKKIPNSVGVVLQESKIISMFYGLHPAWSQVAFFTNFERDLFTNFILRKKYDKSFCFELLNDIIDGGGDFLPHFTGKKCFDIDSNKDIKRLKKIICQN